MWCVLCISPQGKVGLFRVSASVCMYPVLCGTYHRCLDSHAWGFPPTCRQQKDVALVNMANILHRAHFSADAAILAHAALDLTSDLFTSHYTLGNIYAVSHKTLQIRIMSLDDRNNSGLNVCCV